MRAEPGPPNPALPPLEDARVGVYGLGRSGRAAARLLRARGARVVPLDDAPGEPLDGFPLARRPDSPAAFAGLDLLVISPGIPLHAEGRRQAEAAGVRVVGELLLAAALFSGRIVLVTGSHGKSTVTTWLAALLQAQGRDARACGNLGTPLSQVVLGGDLPETAVVEASSFQLCDAPGLRVGEVVFTAYAPNHLDWHPSEAHYQASKLGVLEGLAPGGRVTYLPGFPGLPTRLQALPGDPVLVPVAEGAPWAYDVEHPGQVKTPHGDVDLRPLGVAALAPLVALAAAAADAGPRDVEAAAGAVKALPHRLEDLGVHQGRRYVNDSKATTPAASAYALARVPGKTVLVLGGKDKGLGFAPYASTLAAAHHLVFTGAARDRLEAELGHLPHSSVEDFGQALEVATQRCPEGGAVLLAPGCSSFDAFENFEARGEAFRAFVERLREGAAA